MIYLEIPIASLDLTMEFEEALRKSPIGDQSKIWGPVWQLKPIVALKVMEAVK